MAQNIKISGSGAFLIYKLSLKSINALHYSRCRLNDISYSTGFIYVENNQFTNECEAYCKSDKNTDKEKEKGICVEETYQNIYYCNCVTFSDYEEIMRKYNDQMKSEG